MYNPAPLYLSILPVTRRDRSKKGFSLSGAGKSDEMDPFMGFVHFLMRDHAPAPKGHHGGGISDRNGISENTLNFCLIIQTVMIWRKTGVIPLVWR